MHINFNLIIFSLLLIWCTKEASTKKFRGFIKSCNGTSPECLKSFAQSTLARFMGGIPELGIDSLDPFVFANVQLKLPGGLKLEFIEGQTSGFKHCQVGSVRVHDTEYELMLHCNLTMQGKYRSTGRLLMFPVNGEGESRIRCANITIKVNFELVSKIASDGREHMMFKKFDTEHKYDGQVRYNLTNIIKGNPELSNVVLDFMNSNWRMVAEEFGNPIVNYGISTILKSVKKLFKLVPSDELIVE